MKVLTEKEWMTKRSEIIHNTLEEKREKFLAQLRKLFEEAQAKDEEGESD